MTPTEEATFIRLYQEGASYRDIAQAMPCAIGTVASRVANLVAQGKIQPRRRAKARQDGPEVPPDTPGVSSRVSGDTPSVQYLPPSPDEMRPLLQDILLELRQLTGALAARGVDRHPWGVT
jgi:hypothetical protein